MSRENKRRSTIISWPDERTKPAPMIGDFYFGWSTHSPTQTPIRTISPKELEQEKEEEFTDADDTSFGSRTSSSVSFDQQFSRRASSVKLGNEVMMEMLERDNVRHAIEILQQAMTHLDMTQTDEDEGAQDVCKVYSQVIKSLCDPNISKIVEEMTPGKTDIYNSVLWRLFTKVVESGYVLQRDAHLLVVTTLVRKGHKALALQAMYALPRKEWDTQCYQTAVSLHLMQEPKQILKAQGLVSDYGKIYLEFANPMAPTELPPLRVEMPLMKDVTENDQFELWMYYQTVESKEDDEWNKEKHAYEVKREENLQAIKERENNSIDWALEHLNLVSEKLKVDRLSTENDNTMIFEAIQNNQFEYGWQVYDAMGDAVNESTPCIIMHLCWTAFRQIPISDISYRSDWERRAWSVYSRFMCSEYLHPEQPEAPIFLHDILSIATQTPETTVDKRARYTKISSVHHLLVRLNFDKLLVDVRILEPMLCALLYECQGIAVSNMCTKAFDLWDKKSEILQKRPQLRKGESYAMLWGWLILCLKSGNRTYFQAFVTQLLDHDLPSSLMAPIQTFHDLFICKDISACCYFQEYMFRYMEFTDDLNQTQPVDMDAYGFLLPSDDSDQPLKEQRQTNIMEPQEPNIALAVLLGVAKQEILVPKQMFYSTKKAKALVRHCLKVVRNK